VLAAKGIEYECVNINLKDKPEWFLEINPLGKVPTIEMPDGKVIYESAICCGKWSPNLFLRDFRCLPPQFNMWLLVSILRLVLSRSLFVVFQHSLQPGSPAANDEVTKYTQASGEAARSPPHVVRKLAGAIKRAPDSSAEMQNPNLEPSRRLSQYFLSFSRRIPGGYVPGKGTPLS